MRQKSNFSLDDAKFRFVMLYKSCTVIALSLFLNQIASLQITESDKLQKDAVINMTDFATIQHPRGTINDRNGVVLAKSIMRASLCCDPSKIIDIDPDRVGTDKEINMRLLAAQKLHKVLDMEEDELLKIFNKTGTRFEWVKRTISQSEYEAAIDIIEKNGLNGFYVRRENKRFYPKGQIASHVLGFMSSDDNGASGIEYYLDKELKGIKTFTTKIFSRKNKQLYNEDAKQSIEYRNSDVYLTIDSRMQYTLENALEKAVTSYKAKGAAAIIMDPYTGEILSMATLPTFDPNHYDDYPKERWTNRCVNTVYEPGSVFKPIVGCIGMNKGVVNSNTSFYDAGYISIADRTFRNWDGHGSGWITFTDIIKNSINTGMIELGKRIGKHDIVEGAKNFGFGECTGVDLPGEADGILYPQNMWDPDLASFSIGQGIAVTPLQELRAICAIANGGELLKPYIVKEIIDADGKTIHIGKKDVVRRVVSKETAKEMSMMMEKVVSEGGGKKAAIPGYRIAGKTGTAEKKSESGGYAKGEYITSFVGFVPADKPKYAMLVLVDTPQGSNIYGSHIAAPIFKNVLWPILTLKGIEPDGKNNKIDRVVSHTSDTYVNLRVKGIPKIEILPNNQVRLPDLTGADVATTMEILERGKLRLRPEGSGYAYKQEPLAGAVVKTGSVVKVWYKRD